MGPSDGKSLIYSDVSKPSLSSSSSSGYHSRKSMHQQHNTSASSNSGGGGGLIHIDKNDISGPTNFRHVQRGMVTIEDYAAIKNKNSSLQISSPSSLNKSILTSGSNVMDNGSVMSGSIIINKTSSQVEPAKSIHSLSSSSSSSNVQHGSPTNQQPTEKLVTVTPNFKKPNSTTKTSLYNGVVHHLSHSLSLSLSLSILPFWAVFPLWNNIKLFFCFWSLIHEKSL